MAKPVLLFGNKAELDLLKARVKGYTRKDGAFVAEHDDKRVAKAPPAIDAHADALRRSSKDGDLDHYHNQHAAKMMAEGNHKALSNHLRNIDTAARDHILDHIHPDHWSGLGFDPLNKERSVKKYGAKFGAKQEAKPAGGDAAHKEGEEGHQEHQQYGKYFRKGDKVRDQRGNEHEVMKHTGAEVTTTKGEKFHPTKLFHATPR